MSETGEQLQQWLESIELIDEGYIPQAELGDSYRWFGKIKTILKSYKIRSREELMASRVRFPDYYGMAFVGPGGTGKKRTALSIVGELYKNYGYTSAAVLSPMEIDDAENANDVNDRIDILMQDFQEQASKKEEYFSDDNVKRACIVLDELSQSKYYCLVLKRISSWLEWFDRYRCVPPFVICIEESEKLIPNALRRCLFMCRFDLPNEEEREQYLQNYVIVVSRDELYLTGEEAEKIRIDSDDMSINTLAKMTDAFSYQQLYDFVNYCKLSVLEQAVQCAGFGSVEFFKTSEVSLKDSEVKRIIALFEKRKTLPSDVQPISIKVDVPNVVQQNPINYGKEKQSENPQKKEINDYFSRDRLNLLNRSSLND